MSERLNERSIPSRRFFSTDEALELLTEEFSEPVCAGSDDELSAEELDPDDDSGEGTSQSQFFPPSLDCDTVEDMEIDGPPQSAPAQQQQQVDLNIATSLVCPPEAQFQSLDATLSDVTIVQVPTQANTTHVPTQANTTERTPQWKSQRSPVTVTPFVGETGPSCSLPSTVLGLFRLLLTSSILETIVEQTNLYAQQQMGNEVFATWTAVTVQEMLAFFGFSILMSINYEPSIADYWRSDEVFYYAPIAGRITRDRFFDISRYLHFVDNNQLPGRTDPRYHRLQKVKPIIDAVTRVCMTIYNPSANLSIDEVMIAFKGRSAIKQYMPKKPTKRGIKVWVRSDSSNGFVCQFNVYTGKEGSTTEVGLGGKVVKALTRSIMGRNHRLFMDNYFSSVPLFQDLLQERTYACGTLRNDRKYLPTDMKAIAKKGLRNRGDFEFRQDEELVMTVWQDTKPVCMLSTLWDPEDVVTVRRKRKDGSRIDVRCPAVVDIYNKNMGGVDKGDQYRKYYELRMKSRKVYKYIFWFLVEVCILNSYILHRYSPTTGRSYHTFKDFRVELAKQLIGDYNGRKRRGRPVQIMPAPSPNRPNLMHFPKKTTKGRCAHCSTQGKRRETSWHCTGCNVRLCHTGVEETDCFATYHIFHGIYNRQ